MKWIGVPFLIIGAVLFIWGCFAFGTTKGNPERGNDFLYDLKNSGRNPELDKAEKQKTMYGYMCAFGVVSGLVGFVLIAVSGRKKPVTLIGEDKSIIQNNGNINKLN